MSEKSEDNRANGNNRENENVTVLALQSHSDKNGKFVLPAKCSRPELSMRGLMRCMGRPEPCWALVFQGQMSLVVAQALMHHGVKPWNVESNTNPCCGHKTEKTETTRTQGLT